MKDRETVPAKNPARAAREKRLAEALRANLRRRKSAVQPQGADASGGRRENGSVSTENQGEGS